MLLIIIESLVLCFLLSSFSISNILGSPLSRCSQNLRTIFICTSIGILLFNIVATKRKQIRFLSSLFMVFISSIVFTQSLFWSSCPIFFGNASFIFLKKIYIDACFIDTLINSAAVSFLISFTTIHIYNLSYYSQAVGLFSFIKNKGKKDLNHGGSIFLCSVILNLCLLVLYFFVIHTPWRYISLFIRISPHMSSIKKIILHLIKIGISNTVFYFVYLILDRIVQFNISFYFEDIQAEISPESCRKMSFYRALSQYKKREIKLKYHSKQIKLIEDYIDDQLTLIEDTVASYSKIMTKIDAIMYVTVPQANKNYIKKYYGLDIFEFAISYLKYFTTKAVFYLRFRYIIDNFLDIYEAIYAVRNQENIIIFSDIIRQRMAKIISKGGKVDIFKAPLAEMRLFINKLN